MFETEEQFSRFSGLPANSELFDQLNMDVVEECLCGFSSSFPKQFIHIMNPDYKVAEYRFEVFRDLYKESAWKYAEELCNHISSLHSKAEAINNMPDSTQKKIANVHVAAQYFTLLEQICSFASSCHFYGLHRILDVFQPYLQNMKIANEKSAVFKTENFLNSFLRISIKIDRIRKKITFVEPECETFTDLQTLDNLCQRLTGVPVLQPFSIVDANSPTILEKISIDYILEKNECLAKAIKETPDVDINWEQLILFQTQISFYVAFIKLAEQLEKKGLPFCFAGFDETCRFCAHGIYDLSLSIHRMEDVDFCQTQNDIDLDNNTLGFILTGANQGGKTTFLRATGISVYLSMCGCPAPAKSIILRPYRAIVALFGGEEDRKNESSRFELEVKKYCFHRDNLVDSTFVLLNEFFTGTNRIEEVNILGQCLIELINKHVTFGCVTHFQEVCEILGDSVNSRIQYLRAEHPTVVNGKKRYIIEKGFPDGRAYSENIVRNLGMTYDSLLRQFEERGICGV